MADAAAGIDVFEMEPMPSDHPLSALPNTVLTPHIAAGTRDSFGGKMDSVLSNVAPFFDGKPLQNEVMLGSA